MAFYKPPRAPNRIFPGFLPPRLNEFKPVNYLMNSQVMPSGACPGHGLAMASGIGKSWGPMRPLRQATGPPRLGAGVGVGMLRGGFKNLTEKTIN